MATFGLATFEEAKKGTLAGGIFVWRIENFEVVPVKEAGTFFNGDSYIVYYVTDGKGKEPGPYGTFLEQKKVHAIHFWLGQKTSVDESTTAVIKTVEFDDALKGIATQYREVQGHESKKFLSYFPKGIRYMEGGVATGLTKADLRLDKSAKLYKVKGRRSPIVTQMSKVCWSEMNKV